jgi:hypothetical protein
MSIKPSILGSNVTPRHAAIVAGLVYLFNTTPLAEYLYSSVVVSGNIEQTTLNLATHKMLVMGAFIAYLLNFVGDVVMAWALYFLLAPVSRAMSLLAAWFQLIFAAVALGVTMRLLDVWDLVNEPALRILFDPSQLHAQVGLLLHSFRDGWSMSLSLFGIHLVLAGSLIVRSTYVPKLIGALLIVNGIGWIAGALAPYLLPDSDLGFISVTYFGEAVFMLWLLIKGWRISIPSAAGGLMAQTS